MVSCGAKMFMFTITRGTTFGCHKWSQVPFWQPNMVPQQGNFWQLRTNFGCQTLPYLDQFWLPKWDLGPLMAAKSGARGVEFGWGIFLHDRTMDQFAHPISSGPSFSCRRFHKLTNALNYVFMVQNTPTKNNYY